MLFRWQAMANQLSRMKPNRKDCQLFFCLSLLLFIGWFGKDIKTFFTGPAEVRIVNLTQPTSEIKTILLWTAFFDVPDYIPPLKTLGCAESRCEITSNRNLLSKSDAIIFHLRDTNHYDLPPTRFPWQRWVLLNYESPLNSPKSPVRKLDGMINWTITYRMKSDIVLTPLPYRITRKTQNTTKDYSRNKTSMAAWFVSNCYAQSNRQAFISQLSKTISIDIYGDCGSKKCVPKQSDKCYQDASKKYRFYLSFENSICKDYVTEKLYTLLDYDMVPVVFGGADYKIVAPPGSYINALDFKSPRDLGKHLLNLAKSPENYNKFFEWRNEYEMRVEHYACQLCEKLHNTDEPFKVWTNLYEWLFVEAHCRSWP